MKSGKASESRGGKERREDQDTRVLAGSHMGSHKVRCKTARAASFPRFSQSFSVAKLVTKNVLKLFKNGCREPTGVVYFFVVISRWRECSGFQFKTNKLILTIKCRK